MAVVSWGTGRADYKGAQEIVDEVSRLNVVAEASVSSGLGVVPQSGIGVVAEIKKGTVTTVSTVTAVTDITNPVTIDEVQSGLISITPATLIKTGPLRLITAASGGEVLHSGDIQTVVIKALEGNTGDIYIGGMSGYQPYSGYGFCLSPGEGKSYDVNNFNVVYACATTSGDIITFDGIL